MEKEQENNDVVEQEETSNEENEHETNNESESETEETEQGGEQQSATKSETPEQRLARLKRQLEREEKKQGIKKEDKPEETGDERYDRLELKTEGITTKKEQDVVLDYAKWKGVSVAEVLKNTGVKAELAEMRKQSSVPPPSGRSSNGQSASVDYYASQIKKGAITLSQVESPEMRKQLRKMRIFS